MWKKRVTLGHGRVCSVNADLWSLPGPGGSTYEFISEPTSYRWKPALSSSTFSTDYNSTREGSSVGHASWSRGVTWGGLHHIILKIWFIKYVRQISPPPNPFPAGTSTGPSFPMILPQSSSEPSSHLLPSLLDVFFSCDIQILPSPYFEEWFPTASWSWGISLAPRPGGSLLPQSRFIQAHLSADSSPCERLPHAAQIPSFRMCSLGLGPSSGERTDKNLCS